MYKGKLCIHQKGMALYFWSDVHGEQFSVRQPHSGLYWRCLNLLKRRGFSCDRDPVYENNYKCISKYHRILRHDTKGIVVLTEITPTGFKINIGTGNNYSNSPCVSSFTSNWHDEYVVPTYVELKLLELESLRLQELVNKLGIEIIPDEDTLSAVEKILKKESRNKHIHGGPTCLEDIEKGMSAYALGHYSNDANGKKIRCGQVKYYYDEYEGRYLRKGVVWHNINNMWWVLSGGECRNLACFQLFDYNPSLPRKKPYERQQAKIRSLIDRHSNAMDFERCIQLRQVLAKIS